MVLCHLFGVVMKFPAIHWHLYRVPVCTGRQWQEDTMIFTKQRRKVTCKRCIAMMPNTPLRPDRLHTKKRESIVEKAVRLRWRRPKDFVPYERD